MAMVDVIIMNGTKFYAILSKDLKRDLPDVEGLSESNIRYCKRFYQLYKDAIENLPQLVEITWPLLESQKDITKRN